MSIRIYRGLPAEAVEQPTFMTIGNFDGVHRGHQALVRAMSLEAHAAGCQAGVLTFAPHPLAVLRPQVPLYELTSIDERIALLDAHGLDFVVILPFDRDVASTSAADFMRAMAERMRLRSLWVGPDFALGRGREGTPDRLKALGEDLGYSVNTVDLVGDLGSAVHSSRIRALLDEGAVAEAHALLGRPYQVWGNVAHGAARGKRLGFPTANLEVAEGRLVPAFGIYACWAWVGEDLTEGHPAAVSIGVRPTFDHGTPSVEAYLLDFDSDLYDQKMGLSFIRRLRPELHFPSPEALIAQMTRDVESTRAILADPPDDSNMGLGRKGEGSRLGPLAGEPENVLPTEIANASTAAESQRDQSNHPAVDKGGECTAWEELPHTADWTVRLRGATLRELLARAAQAMFSLQEADTSRPVALARAVSVQADDTAELLVAWLNRLLLNQELYGEMYTRFELTDLSRHSLQAVVYGYKGTPSRTAVKAVTFWDLAVQQTEAGWVARVTFDV